MNALKNDFKYRIINGLIEIIACLPLSVLYLIGDVVCFFLHRVFRYRLRIVRKNLADVFKNEPVEELRHVENAFYRHLVEVFVETLKLAHISDKEMMRRVSVEGIELVNDAVARGQSVVLMLGHYGNWEWVTASAMHMDRKAVICEIYHPLRNKAFDRVMLRLRSRFGTENIPMSKSVRRLLSIHREGGVFVCGFIADQRPFSRDLKHWTDFCGIDTAYVNGGEVIGCKISAEFLYAEMLPLRRGYYKLSFSRLEPLDDNKENPYSRAFLQRLEASVISNPPYWLWSHNRWKRKRVGNGRNNK